MRRIDGEEFPAAQDFAALARRLVASGNWFKPHSDHLIIDPLKRIRKVHSSRYDLPWRARRSPRSPRSTPPTSSLVSRSRLSIRNLDHVVPFDRVAFWILKEKLKEFKKPIHLMTRKN